MENFIASLLAYVPSNAVALVVVVIAFVWIQTQRKDIGKKRDEFQTLTEYRLKLLETGQNDLKDSITALSDQIHLLDVNITKLSTILDKLERK